MKFQKGMVLIIIIMVLLLLNLLSMAMLQIVGMENKMTIRFMQWMSYNLRSYERISY
jgi:Tfp pilus assembly protein PilX